MAKKIAVIISPNWRDYAKKYLEECLISLAGLVYDGELKFFIVDNETSADSRLLLNNYFSEYLVGRPWQVIACADNGGFAKGNNLAMVEAMRQGYDYLALFNMDGMVASGCLSAMMTAMEQTDNVGAVQARIMLWPDKEKINSVGNVTHFLGFGYCAGNGDKYVPSGRDDYKQIAYPSGAAVLFNAKALKAVGLFDEEFWMYNEDQDLGWRLWLFGWQCLLAETAVFYHKYQFAKSVKQFYWQDRNRLLAVIKNYHWLTLLILSPAFLISEAGLWLTAWRGGWFTQRLKVYGYFCLPSTWLYLIKARRVVQKNRLASDRSIVRLFGGKILYQELDSPLVRVANILLNGYWQLAKFIIVW